MIRLGSSSLTRANILRENGIDFIQSGSSFDEDTITTKDPKKFVYEATMGKYKDCLEQYGLNIPLLVADTVVTAQGELLRKPKDLNDAKRILKLQSASRTSIITCMIYRDKDQELIDISSTHYDFSKFDDEDLEKYLQSNEWSGKAGGCMVEGFCKKYIKNVEGYESCAMGLTIEKLFPKLLK